MSVMDDGCTGVEIAVIGMAGRFPGAPDVETFWTHLCNGVESVTTFSDEELRARGVPEELLSDPAYVKAGAVFEGADRFDAPFFGYTPRDAEYLDPQHRLLLETAWHALEHAGYNRATWPELTGIYAGSGANLYLMRNLLPAVDWSASGISSLLSLLNSNNKDAVATRVAYKLDLRGPAVSVQTACSTSLVAVHFACRGLLNHEADLALAGGVSLNLLQDGGYRYEPGAILSPDGHCRAFDAKAGGTLVGSGAGIVVLKRLADAIADRDTIYAVIKGSALNNDGASKVGYTAPSVEGQAQVIRAAQSFADVPADSIGYVEAHGTGTTLGDPIEVAALTQAFRHSTQRKSFCALGSVKTNIGHLDAAAGVAALIKSILAVQRGVIPPSLNFSEPNPRIEWTDSPFFVNTQLRPWASGPVPRRAGVSSFGMGGTNVHVIVQEPPRKPTAAVAARDLHVLPISARSEAALSRAIEQLASHIESHPEQRLQDVAHTLRVGRKRFEYRCAVVARDHAEAARALRERTAGRFFSSRALGERPGVAFLFPGQGSQYVGMGRALYETASTFKATVDTCCDLLKPHLGVDLRDVMYATAAEGMESAARLDQTALTQPALFVTEYALAQLWMKWGLRPAAMLGHSIGEYVAACLAGVFSLQDALQIVAARGQLMQATAPGAMLAVNLRETALLSQLAAGCDLAAVNGNESCVLSGTAAAIDAAERDLQSRNIPTRRLQVSRAFHSRHVEPVLDAFGETLSKARLSAPSIPFVSNLTGRWIQPEEACNPRYWQRHMRETVRFAAGVDELLEGDSRILLEVGPGETLANLVARHRPGDTRFRVLSSQQGRAHREQNGDRITSCVAQLWVAGAQTVPPSFDAESASRVPLPTYPFEHKSYWIAPAGRHETAPRETAINGDDATRFYLPTWTRTDLRADSRKGQRPIPGVSLVLGGWDFLTDALTNELRASGRAVVSVKRAGDFSRLGDRHFAVRPGERADIEAVLRTVAEDVGPVAEICHLWSLHPAHSGARSEDVLDETLYGFVDLLQALNATRTSRRRLSIAVVTNQLADVSGAEAVCPEKSALPALCTVLSQEHPELSARVIDVGPGEERWVANRLMGELEIGGDAQLVALRGSHRWVRTFERAAGARPVAGRLRRNGVYLITGGLGGIGLALSKHLAQKWQARLVLAGRQPSEAALRAVSVLESQGAEVLVVRADVTDEEQLRKAIAQVRLRFGDLHGVIHAAGIEDGERIASAERDVLKNVLAPKVKGTRHLLGAIEPQSLDFVLLCSSLSAIAGGIGLAGYAAANAVMDAIAHQAALASNAPVLSINWDGWRGVGMARDQTFPDGVGIDPEQGGALLERLLSLPAAAQILVSTMDLEQRLQLARLQELPATLPTLHVKQQKQERPSLATPYVAPAGELEQRLAGVFEDALGLKPLGADDSLFELGGDSLLAIQVLGRVRQLFDVVIQPGPFFETPTVAALASLVEAQLIDEIERDTAGVHEDAPVIAGAA